MTKRIYNCRDIELPHDQMVSLRKLGKLNLGLDDLVAMKLATSGVANARSIRGAFNLWRFAAFATLAYSVYLSFTYQWWCFMPGFLVFGIMVKATNAGNVGNLLETAMVDKTFYERVRSMNGWQYQIDESDITRDSATQSTRR